MRRAVRPCWGGGGGGVLRLDYEVKRLTDVEDVEDFKWKRQK